MSRSLDAALDTDDRRFAYRVLRAWPRALRDRLTVEGLGEYAPAQPTGDAREVPA